MDLVHPPARPRLAPVRTVARASASAVVFLAGTFAGRLVAATVAACAVMSTLDLGVTYAEKAFVGAGLAVTASVVSELGFGLFVHGDASAPAHAWRAVWRGFGAVGGALFASGGLNALELSEAAHTVLLVVIAWIAIGPVLAEIVAAYNERARTVTPADARFAGAQTAARRTREGAAGLRALLGAGAFWGLAAYGLAQVVPALEWWVFVLPVAVVLAALSVSVLWSVAASEFGHTA